MNILLNIYEIQNYKTLINTYHFLKNDSLQIAELKFYICY